MSSDTRLQKRPRSVGDGHNLDTDMDGSDEEILDDETPPAAKPTYANKASVMTKPRDVKIDDNKYAD